MKKKLLKSMNGHIFTKGIITDTLKDNLFYRISLKYNSNLILSNFTRNIDKEVILLCGTVED